MNKIYYKWRYYTLGQDHYLESIKKITRNNIVSLKIASIVVCILGFCFTCFPLFIEKNFLKAGVYFFVIFIAIIIYILANVILNQYKNGKKSVILKVYLLTTLHYINIIMFGIYIGVITSPDGTATTFMSLLICALFLFINPPLYNLLLTLVAMIVFIILCVFIKEPNIWIFDIFNVLIAGLISIIFSWLISMYRMVSVFNAGKLEEERNNY